VLQNADLLINQSMDHPIWTQPIFKKIVVPIDSNFNESWEARILDSSIQTAVVL